MPMPIVGLAAMTSLAASGVWTASDPFVGKWKLDVSRSAMVDQMVVEAAGPNRYRFSFEGGPAETIAADGTDQPGLPGTTLAIRSEDPHSLTVVRKQDGRIIVSASWKLSQDGKTLRDDFTAVQADGSTATTHYVYRRMSGSSGFAGAWESTTPPVGLKVELQIQAEGVEKLSFATPGSAKSVTFDGRDHAVAGPVEGLTRSGRRLSARALEYTEKTRGQVDRTRALKLSPDDRTLTMTIRTPGRSTPDVLVFGRD
jgi:hypothetical protein